MAMALVVILSSVGGFALADVEKGTLQVSFMTGNIRIAVNILAQQLGYFDGPISGNYQDKTAKAVKKIELDKSDEGSFLSWDAPANGREQKADDAIRFVVYEFLPGEKLDINNSQAIVALTPFNRVSIANPEPGLSYAVTTLDRLNRESDPIFLYVK